MSDQVEEVVNLAADKAKEGVNLGANVATGVVDWVKGEALNVWGNKKVVFWTSLVLATTGAGSYANNVLHALLPFLF